jgi:hypothetical protein
MNDPIRSMRWLLLPILAFVSACDTIPKDALAMTPETLEHRQLQTRRFDGTDEKTILAASAGVLQDLGFNLDESEVELGVIVASKDRSAVSAAQVTGAVVAALFGAYTAIDKTQKVRVSLVVRPQDSNVSAHDSKNFLVRVTFQRIIWNTQGQITKIEPVDETEIYQEFFDKLSKSLFLTANEV